MFGRDRASWLLPGPLSRAHGDQIERCEGCHDVAARSPLAWPEASLHAARSGANDRLCLACHELGCAPLAPHGLAPQLLDALSARAREEPVPDLGLGDRFAARVAELTRARHEPAACSACHQEHRGRDASLVDLADAQCQSCHARKFPSLGAGHPDFVLADRARSLRFDHAGHEARHFPQGDRAYACAGCHGSGADPLPLARYEEACASCHDSQIRGDERAAPSGIPLFGFPGLDLRTLAAAGHEIRAWPREAEAAPSPLLRLLLGPATPELEGVDLLDLSGSEPGELEAVGRFASAVLELGDALATRGHAALAERLAERLGRPLAAGELADLLGGFDSATLERALGALEPQPQELSQDPRPEERWLAAGGFYASGYEHAVVYRPAAHADRFLRAWLELCAELASRPGPSQRIAAAAFASLADPAAPGACAKCHELRAERLGWRSPGAPASASGLTRFSHAPHVLAGTESCGGCHALAPPASGRADADFAPLELSSCTPCHAAERAGERCLQCHLYHGRDAGGTAPGAAGVAP